MSQESQPVSDVSIGNWKEPPIFSKINDPYPGESTYVSSEGSPTGDTFEVRLKALKKPKTGNQTLTVRMKKSAGSSQYAWMSLVQSKPSGEPIIIAARRVDPTSEFDDYSITLNEQEAKRITNYSFLILRVSAIRDNSSSSSSKSTSSSGGSSSGSSTSGGSSTSSISSSPSSSISNSGSSLSSGGYSLSSNSYVSSSSVSSGSFSSTSRSDSSSNSGSSLSSGSYSLSSGSNSSSGIFVPCSPDPIAATLHATFGGCLAEFGVVTLTYSPGGMYGNGVWTGEGFACNGPSIVEMECLPNGQFGVLLNGSAFPAGGAAYATINPFYLYIENTPSSYLIGQCCPDTPSNYTITVTETSP